MIIGSTAIKHWYSDFTREPKDVDVATREKYNSSKSVELLYNPIIFNYSDSPVLEADLLLTLKMSHLFWDINWKKHMYDVQFLLSKGCVYNKELFDNLYTFWNTIHGENVRSDLNMSKADFFNNALKEYDHDYLHTLINPIPTYTKMLKGEVDICEDKWYNSTIEDKDNLIREEVYVMAFERFQDKWYRVAYELMMKKYIINHAPMYVALYLIENYRKLHTTDFDFITYLKEKI